MSKIFKIFVLALLPILVFANNDDYDQVVATIKSEFVKVIDEYKAGNVEQAVATVQNAYFGYFEDIEAGIRINFSQKKAYAMEKQFGEQNLLSAGRLKKTQSLAQLAQSIELKLERKPVVVGDAGREIRRIAWCTGGAQGFFQTAIDEGVDAYVTGEISEAQYHLANETGVAFISAGHHATERYGIRALGEALAQRFDVVWCCFDEPNPA